MSVPHTSSRTLLDDLLAECVRRDASDLHLAPELPPFVRVHGIMEPLEAGRTLSAEQLAGLVAELGRNNGSDSLARTGSLDGAVGAPDGTRFRFNAFRRHGAHSIAIRRLEDRFRSLTELGLPESLHELGRLPDGLVLVAGPTGSGKSTTLATLLDRVNRTRRSHIVTIEDPIEYVHSSQLCLVNQRQVGLDASNFHDALVAALRQDPDVILVGEIRDLATIRTAITAAETGHLVFTTVHAGDCVGAIERLIAVFPADEQHGIRRQLGMVLRAVIAQHLMVADGSGRCTPTEQPVRRRRVVASEVLRSNPAVANLIATGKTNQIYSLMESGTSHGMQTLEHDLARLWSAGHIAESSAMAMARNPALLRDRVTRRKPAMAGR